MKEQGKRGCGPAFSVVRTLPPVTFNHDPAAMATHPVMTNPDCVHVRWAHPTAWYPDIAAIIPAVIAADPYEAGLRRRTGTFNEGSRRRDPNKDLRERRRRKQSESEKQRECNFLHYERVLQRVNVFEKPGWVLVSLQNSTRGGEISCAARDQSQCRRIGNI